MNHQVEVAREFMKLMREFRQPIPNEDGSYEGMLECDVRDLAQGAAVLIEATAKFVGPERAAAVAEVRISNLEAMNDNLRVNNEALRANNATLDEALRKMANPVHVVNNHTFVDATLAKSVEALRAAVPIADPGPSRYDAEPESVSE